MTEATTIPALTTESTARRKPVASRDEASGFSYALAAASLEKNAARSLEVHGARPADKRAAAAQTPKTTQHASSLDRSQSKPDQSAQAPSQAPESAASTHQLRMTTKAPPPPAISTAAAPSLMPAPALVQSGPAKPIDAPAARFADPVLKMKAAAKPARPVAESSGPRADFAEILAKRLEKTSSFDIRLDPPDLGRVEGRLTVSDDGKAVLSLAFDNQNAFDLFSRDEQALRQALVQAGLSFAAGDFAFSFRDRPSIHALSGVDTTVPDQHAQYDPVFLAEWSAGALDIRI